MKPRPVYRWKSFWLGVLILGFMGWAWVRSMDRVDTVDFDCGSGYLWGSSFAGIVAVEIGDLDIGSVGRIRNFQVRSEDHRFDRELPPAFQDDSDEEVTLRWRVAHWLLMVLFLMPWLAFLFWRVRKQRRITA